MEGESYAMMSKRTAYAPVRRRCPHCQQMKAFGGGPRQRYCSNRCGILARGKVWLSQHHARLTKIRIANGYTRLVKKLRGLGFTDAQIAVIRTERAQAYAAGYAMGRRKGFAEACGETKWQRPERAA